MQRIRTGTTAAWIGVILLVSLAPATMGAVIHLRNGDRLTGTIQSVESDAIVISTRWQETLRIPMSEVEHLEGKTAGVPGPAAVPVVAGTAAVSGVGAREVPAAAAAPVQAKKPNPWKGSVRLGADLLFSEKDRYLYTGRLKLSHTREHFQSSLDYLASYERTDGDVSANRMDGTSKTDFELPERWYVYNLARAGYDEVRRVDFRYELGPGIGYHIVKSPALSFNVEAGMNYQVENRSDGTDTEMVVGRMAEGLQWRATPRLTLEENFEFLPYMGNWGKYRLRFEGSLEYQLLAHVALSLTVINLYDTTPARTVDQNDLQVRSAVGLTF